MPSYLLQQRRATLGLVPWLVPSVGQRASFEGVGSVGVGASSPPASRGVPRRVTLHPAEHGSHAGRRGVYHGPSCRLGRAWICSTVPLCPTSPLFRGMPSPPASASDLLPSVPAPTFTHSAHNGVQRPRGNSHPVQTMNQYRDTGAMVASLTTLHQSRQHWRNAVAMVAE